MLRPPFTPAERTCQPRDQEVIPSAAALVWESDADVIFTFLLHSLCASPIEPLRRTSWISSCPEELPQNRSEKPGPPFT